jgi:hypothetical protein
MSAPNFRQSDEGASSSQAKKAGYVRGGFVRAGELNRWLSRLSPGKDDWLVGKAVAIAIRRRAKPGTRITMRRLCYLSDLHWRKVMAALYHMRSNGRLQFSKAGVDFDSSFLFEIPSASEEEAWRVIHGQEHQSFPQSLRGVRRGAERSDGDGPHSPASVRPSRAATPHRDRAPRPQLPLRGVRHPNPWGLSIEQKDCTGAAVERCRHVNMLRGAATS